MPKFNSAPANFPILAYYKGSFGLLFTFTNTSDGSQYGGLSDVTGATFTILDQQGETALEATKDAGITIDGGAGTMLLQFTNAQIVGLATQEYQYESLLTFAGGAVWAILDGVFDVTADGTSNTDAPDTFTIRGGTITVTVSQGDFPAA